MKKISILILSIVLIFALALTSKTQVKAKTDAYIDTKVEINIPDSTNGNGCFISFYEWFNEHDDYIDFLKLAFNISSNDFIQILLEGGKKAQNQGYIDENGTPCILYISSEELLNKWLRDNAYIEYGASYKDGITGVNLSNGLHYVKNGYDALYELLQLKGELQAYVIDPDNVPEVFVRKNAEASSYSDTWYVFSDLKKPYIINGTWQYKVLEYEGPVEECSIIELPNSVGKVKQVSSNAYEYVYSEVYYNDEFGYYSLSQDDTKTIQLAKKQLPTFLFDTNGEVKDIYISKQINFWTCPEVKNIYENVEILVFIDNEYYMYDGNYDLHCYIAYVSFIGYSNLLGKYKKFPIDTIEKFSIRYAYTPRYSKFSEWLIQEGWKKRKLTYITSTCVRGDSFTDYGLDHNFWCFLTGNYPKSDVIQKGDYVIKQNDEEIHFDFKIYLTNDEGLSKQELKNNDYLFLTPIDYKAYQNKSCVMDCVVSYQAVIYNLKNITTIPAFPELPDPSLTIWEIILIVLIAILVLMVLILLFKFISWLRNKKNKTSRN